MTQGVYDFTQNLSVSNDYQQVVMDWLRDVRHATVVDRRGQLEYDKGKGIDLEINGEPAQFKADDKVDSTGNIVFELISNLGKGSVGCGAKREARWWLYFGTVSNTLHVIDHHKLIDRINVSGFTSWRGFTTHTKGWNGEVAYATLGMLIPLASVKQMLGNSFKSYSLSEYIAGRMLEVEEA